MSRTLTPVAALAGAERVGIVLLTGIGDVVHGLPIANDLKRDEPARRVLWIAEPVPALGYRVLLVGGPSPCERAVADAVLAAPGTRAVSGLSDSVRRMMCLVAGVDLLVSPDTGPLHHAQALGTPVIGLFGHTNPACVGPWRRFRELVVDRYTELGASSDPTEYEPKLGRMEQVSVEDVLEKVELARARYGSARDALR